MTITATEFKTNFGKYLKKVYDEDIYITKNGKIIAQLSQPQQDKMALLSSLVGLAETDEDIDLDKLKEERLSRQ